MSEEYTLIINEENSGLIDTIVLGGGLRGAGGGGPVDKTRIFAQSIKDQLKNGNEIKFISPENVPDDEWCCTIASMGSPVSQGAVSLQPFYNAWEQMNQILPKKVNYVLAVEVGSWNSIVPYVIALKYGAIVVDGDGAGRAVPTLDLTLMSRVSSNPTVIASDGEFDKATKIGLYVESVDTVQSLAGAILPTEGFKNVGCITMWPCLGARMKELTIPNTLTDFVIPNGENMRKFYEEDPSTSIQKLIESIPGAKLIISGTVTNKHQQTSKALDLTNITVDGHDADGNPCEAVVYGQNENLFVFKSGIQLPAIVGPDMACWCTLKQPEPLEGASIVKGIQPYDNSTIREGDIVSMIAIPSNTVTSSDDDMMARWRKTMKPLGYAGEQKSGIFLEDGCWC